MLILLSFIAPGIDFHCWLFAILYNFHQIKQCGKRLNPLRFYLSLLSSYSLFKWSEMPFAFPLQESALNISGEDACGKYSHCLKFLCWNLCHNQLSASKGYIINSMQGKKLRFFFFWGLDNKGRKATDIFFFLSDKKQNALIHTKHANNKTEMQHLTHS